jgi:hypothetical protein
MEVAVDGAVAVGVETEAVEDGTATVGVGTVVAVDRAVTVGMEMGAGVGVMDGAAQALSRTRARNANRLMPDTAGKFR